MSQEKIAYTAGGLKVAVIGGGISGLVAAHLLSRRNHVTIFEKETHLGGHTYTAKVPAHSPSGEEKTLPVDMGFIVFNIPNYPVFNAFINALGVKRAKSNMSFAFYNPETDFMYAGTGLRGLFAHKKNIISLDFWKMLYGIRKFGVEAKQALLAGKLSGKTLGEYLRTQKYGSYFTQNYLLPMAEAIWSTPEGDIRSFPAETLVHFFDNHLLLEYTMRPQWYYIEGGSDTYVRAFRKQFSGDIHTSTVVTSVTRHANHVHVMTDKGSGEFDTVVLATHANVSLRILTNPTEQEHTLLSPWKYADNRVVLHTDDSFLPPKAAGRASWNVIRDPLQKKQGSVGVSYYMNRLQNIAADKAYVVTLNPVREPKLNTLLEDKHFAHPQYSLAAIASQNDLPKLDGINRTFFCGAYHGYGFHEDGAASGARVARHFGESL